LKVNLNELGFDDFFNKFRQLYLNPLSKRFYPEIIKTDCDLDSHKIFIVKYKIDQDTSLSYHFGKSVKSSLLTICN
jgi:hypothetical protein